MSSTTTVLKGRPDICRATRLLDESGLARHNTKRCAVSGTCRPSDYPSLAIVIAQIRRELTEALEEGQRELVQFVVGEIELEFAVEVEKTGGGEGGIRLGVVALAAKGEAARSDSNRRIESTRHPGRGAGTAQT